MCVISSVDCCRQTFSGKASCLGICWLILIKASFEFPYCQQVELLITFGALDPRSNGLLFGFAHAVIVRPLSS